MNKLGCIFLIDDDYPTNYFHRIIIEEVDCAEEIVICQSGQEALSQLTDRMELGQPTPDLIFLDINMPGMTGWEFLERYQNLPTKAHGKVLVVLTTSLNPDDEKKAHLLDGVDGFRRKPLSGEMLTDLMQEYF
jgi:CheY-like chemotaxis protein